MAKLLEAPLIVQVVLEVKDLLCFVIVTFMVHGSELFQIYILGISKVRSLNLFLCKKHYIILFLNHFSLNCFTHILLTNSIDFGSSDCKENNSPTYIGCFSDDEDQDLKDGPKFYGFTIQTCNHACQGYNYFAVQYGGRCVCGNAYATKPQYEQKADVECDRFGYNAIGMRNSIYKTCDYGKL